MILCIDTTTSAAGIYLVDMESQKIHFHCFGDLSQAAETILEFIDTILKAARIQPADLTGVMAIIGPGSFTGLRIGISVANQFAHQLNIPIFGLRTDEWWRYRTDEKTFAYLQTMNRNEVYFGVHGPKYHSPKFGVRTLKGLDFGSRTSDSIKWLGDLSDLQRGELPEKYEEILGLRSPELTWLLVAKDHPMKRKKAYDLLEPWYGKGPTITKSKRKLMM